MARVADPPAPPLQLKALEDEIDQLVAAHPDGALILSLPGMGATLTA